MSEFVSCRYKKKLGEAKNHVKYISYRERTTGERYGLFNEDKDNIPVKDFLKELDNPRTAHPDIAKIHTLIFSMSGDEWKRSYFKDGDYQDIVRNVMKDWQLQKGITIKWAAAEHNEPGHPHVHVVIPSVYKDRDGVERRLKITPEDKKWFKEAFREEKNRIRGFDLPPREREFERDRMEQKREPDFGKDLLNSLVSQIQQKMREEEFKRQMERDRDIDR